MRLAAFRPSRVLVFFAFLAVAAVAQSPGEIRLHSAHYTLSPLVILTQSNTVPLLVVVRDDSGKVISGLTEDRFRLFDNGAPQKLAAFHISASPAAPTLENAGARAGAGAPLASPSPSAQAAAPRFVALLFDDVNSDKGDLMEARNAATRFLKEEFGPGDHMALFTISNSETVSFTQDRSALAAAIARIGPHPRASTRGLAQCPSILPYEAYLISVMHDPGALRSANADALTCGHQKLELKEERQAAQLETCGLNCTFGMPPPETSDGIPVETQANATWQMALGISQNTLAGVRDVVDYTAKQPGQRIVVLASSGFLTETLEDQREQIIRDALHSGVVINALDAHGHYTEDPGGPVDEIRGFLPMTTWAFEEGAKIPEQEAQEDAMASLALATGGLFFHNNNDLTLGFERLGLAPAATYDLAFTPTPLIRDGKLHKLKLTLSPPIRGASIEARRGYFAPPPGLTSAELEQALNLAMHSNATASAFPAEVNVTTTAGAARVQVKVGITQPRAQVSLVAGLFAASGDFITGERGEMDLTLKDSTFKKLRKTGLAPAFTLTAPAGQYRLRVVVEDSTGALTEINHNVTIP